MVDPSPPQNELGSETSPYLLEHAHDPVAWQAWGEPALERARREQKPIFLSIGYSACHWCHVMQRESFSSERVARVLNEEFVSIKVDREERPDLDELYMSAVLQLTGSGGWPLSVFLSPDGQPFHGGTYYPPVRSSGLPSFLEVLAGIARAWRENRSTIVRGAARVTEALARSARFDARGPLDPSTLDSSLAALESSFDPLWGGFGDAPKFPRATDVRLLLRHHLRTRTEAPLAMARLCLERMAAGGIQDHLGGGFHRYSTDERWVVPHFEKMLYDNALLATTYLEGFLATGEASFGRTARDVLEWALREMHTEDGGFASSQDADSAGEEGSFYVWTPDELRRALGARTGAWAQEWWSVGDDGNFEGGRSVLWREHPASQVAARLRVGQEELERRMAETRTRLYELREQRTRPATDDKVLAGWNSLMASALALASQVFGEERWVAAGRRAVELVLDRMRTSDGKLCASWRAGRARHPASLADHAYLVQALVDLYETDFESRWIREALAQSERISRHFSDFERGGFFTTADDQELLLTRLSASEDGALPSGAGVQISNLLRLSDLTGRTDLAREAERAILARGASIGAHPAAFGSHVLAIDFLSGPLREIALAGELGSPELAEMLRIVRTTFAPHRVVALRRSEADADCIGLLRGKDPGRSRARAWVCSNWTCRAPIDDPGELDLAIRQPRVR
jgi:uncharacterized protein YyaL (SSP411 family)